MIRNTEGAVWVTGVRPRGRGFDLDVDRRIDSNRWVEVTGTVVHDRGLVRIEGTRIAATTAPTEAPAVAETAAPAAPPPPLEIVFFSPSDDETDVSASGAVRVQFSRGVREASLAGRVTAGYTGSRGRHAGRQSGAQSRPTMPPTAPSRSGLPRRWSRSARSWSGCSTASSRSTAVPLKPWALTFSVGRQ